MEEVLSNPGFYHIYHKILRNLDEESIMELGKTNKNILELCHAYFIKNPKGFIYYGDPEFGSKIDPYIQYKIKEFFTFMKENEIFHEMHFKYHYIIKDSQETTKILETFLDKLVQMVNLLKEICQWKCCSDMCPRNILDRIICCCIGFIPSSCPSTSRKNLIELLAFVLLPKRSDQLIKKLLAATKEMDTCMRMIFSALTIPSWHGQQR